MTKGFIVDQLTKAKFPSTAKIVTPAKMEVSVSQMDIIIASLWKNGNVTQFIEALKR